MLRGTRRLLVIVTVAVTLWPILEIAAEELTKSELQEIANRAEHGDADAELQLGLLYKSGSHWQVGILANAPQAALWLRRAADQNNAAAQYELSQMVRIGIEENVPDRQQAFALLKKSADQGYSPAQFTLGQYFYDHSSTEAEKNQGIDLLRQAAAQANSQAIRALEPIDKQIASDQKRKIQQAESERTSVLFMKVFGVLFALSALVLFLKRKTIAERRALRRAAEHAAEAARVETLRRKTILAKVWPSHLFPRIPEHISTEHLKNARDDLNDELLNLWEEPLQFFPKRPTTEMERETGEIEFWRMLLPIFVRNENTSATLIAKQGIIDWWWNRERFIFRYFYAATGVIHPSIFTQRWIDNNDLLYRNRNVRSWNTASATQLRLRDEHNQAERECRDFCDREIPAHKEKWGEWFFMNVERAFKAEYQPSLESNIENQKVHGNARLATEEEALAVAIGGSRRSSIHDEEF